MSYGDHIQQARNALAASLLERPAPAFSAADLRARDLLISSLAEISATIVGPSDARKSKTDTFERGLIGRPTVVMNRLLAATVVKLPTPDPSTVLRAAHDSEASLHVAAKHVTLASADLAIDQRWQSQAAQQWVVAKDVADLTRSTALLDTNRANRDLHPLPNRDRFILAASATSQVATAGRLDFTVDATSRPDTIRVPDGNYTPHLLEAFERQQLVAADLNEIPSYRNLQQVIRHQGQFSAQLNDRLTKPLDRALATTHAERNVGYLRIGKELRTMNGNIGRGVEPATSSGHLSAIIRFGALTELNPHDRNLLAALTSVSERVDDAVANCIQTGLLEGIYHVRAEGPDPQADEYQPRWSTQGPVLRDIGSAHWIRADNPVELPIWQLADNLRPAPTSSPRGDQRRGLRDSLDQVLARAGTGPRPDRPHSR